MFPFHRQSLDKKLQKILIDAIVDLLAHSCPKIRREMYACCHKCVLRSMGVHFTPNRPSTQLSFLFDSKVLTEIVCHGISSEDEKVIILILCFTMLEHFDSNEKSKM